MNPAHLWVRLETAGSQRFVWLKKRRWFRPAAVTFGVALAILLVAASYMALFDRNSVTGENASGVGTSADSKNTSVSKGRAASQATAGPAKVLDLSNWYLTLPVADSGPHDPETIEQPELNGFSMAPYFQVNSEGDGVIFQAPAGGATTKNSKYPRSELREMSDGGTREASWSDTEGTHTMVVREAITHLPSVKPQVVAGQIHDESDDIIMIRLEESHLFVEANGKDIGTLDSSYQLGKVFTVQVTAAEGHIKVSYNGSQKVDYAKTGSGWYFKAGCYTQSNPSKGDSPDAYGQVVIYGLQVNHT